MTPPANDNKPKLPYPDDTCFGPIFDDELFIRWPASMDLRLHKLSVSLVEQLVLRNLVGLWSPKPDSDQRFIVWAALQTLSDRTGLTKDQVAKSLRSLRAPTPSRPALLRVVTPATPRQAARYSLEPLWTAVAAVDVTDVFPRVAVPPQKWSADSEWLAAQELAS